MAAGEFLRPKNPSRKAILDTVGDQGRDEYRNPVHLKAVHPEWPNPETDEARQMRKQGGMEMTPGYRNGSITGGKS